MVKCAFIGLGVMGYPMAGHLIERGNHTVTVYNRTKARADAWVSRYGGDAARTPAQAAAADGGADFVMICVGNDDDLRSVVYGNTGVLAGMKSGAVLIDHTTASAEVAREIALAAQAGSVQMIDGPVSGGQAGAENGTLTVMCGGEPQAFAAAEPIIASYGKAVTWMGGVGSGQLTKMVNQICIAGLLQGLSEGLSFAQRADLDCKKLLGVISKGAAQSWQMDNRGETMVDDKFDFGFAIDWMRKDLGICLDESRRNGASLPVTALVDQFYADLQTAGEGRSDTSCLIRHLMR